MLNNLRKLSEGLRCYNPEKLLLRQLQWRREEILAASRVGKSFRIYVACGGMAVISPNEKGVIKFLGRDHKKC